MGKKRSVQKYTPEGRKEIHTNLDMEVHMLKLLSLFCARFGKCAVTGEVFELLENIHCCHKLPRGSGGKDNYQNLVLALENVHKLTHATAEPTIQKYLSLLNLNKTQLEQSAKISTGTNTLEPGATIIGGNRFPC